MPHTTLECAIQEEKKVSRSTLVRHIVQMGELLRSAHTDSKKHGITMNSSSDDLRGVSRDGEELGFYFRDNELALSIDPDAEDITYDLEDPKRNQIIAADYYRLLITAYRYTLHCYDFGRMKDDVDMKKWKEGDYYYLIDEMWDGPGTSRKARASRIALYILLEEGIVPDMTVECDKVFYEEDEMSLKEYICATLCEEMCTKDRKACDCEFCH